MIDPLVLGVGKVDDLTTNDSVSHSEFVKMSLICTGSVPFAVGCVLLHINKVSLPHHERGGISVVSQTHTRTNNEMLSALPPELQLGREENRKYLISAMVVYTSR